MEEPKIVSNIKILKDEIVDRDKYFRIGYCEEINEYIIVETISWVAWYDRYYLISKEDYELYKINKEDFYEKFADELTMNPERCFKEKFIGSQSLRDYDCVQNVGAFQNYFWWNKILWARILLYNKYYLVSPLRVIKQDNEQYKYLLREANIPFAQMFYKDKELTQPIFFGVELDKLINNKNT